MPSILDFIKPQAIASSIQMEQFEQLISIKKFSKGEIVERKGDISKKAFFVKEGCLRSYTIDEKGKEHVFMFAPEGWIVSDIATQFNNMPSDLFIDALEDSEVEVFDRRLFDLIGKFYLKVNVLSNEKLINRIAVLQKRIILLMSATAWERYQDFLGTYPSIIQRVPQRMIASYLGITPEALSKLRGEMTKTALKK